LRHFSYDFKREKKGPERSPMSVEKLFNEGIHFETFPVESRIEALLFLSPKHDEPFYVNKQL